MPAPTNGLVLHWNMETLSGAQMDDLAGTNRGTITGAVDATGQVGQARAFDGVDDKIVFDRAVLGPTAGSFTIAFWGRPIAGVGLAVSLWNIANHLAYATVGTKWNFNMTSGATSVNIVSNSFASAVWRHIAGRYNGHTLYLFVGGNTQSSVAQTGTFTWSDMTVGGRVTGDNDFTGRIDELRVYSRALSLTEIQSVRDDTQNYGLPDKVRDFRGLRLSVGKGMTKAEVTG